MSAPRAKPTVSTRWLRTLSRANLATLLVLYIISLHLIGLFVFIKGFLLTRVTIPTISPAYPSTHQPPVPPTHAKALVLIIDALRTDFISPYHSSPPSPFHHGVLTLPAELSAAHPEHSLIFNAYSDPPTSTMQRLKGITTGSLPTFIDVGSNFASTAIDEDSLISQLVAANKRVGFMGDETWLNLFPDSFNLSHPYDSFNVEDLHTVDNGVIEHLIPYLQPERVGEWDFLIGHFLGVDHVGHRVGPSTETMRTKLEQMDQVLRQVVELLQEDTLLVVLGDHGMDSKGNHGGDSDMEVASGLWIYSKGPALSPILTDSTALPTYTFPGSARPLRHVNQIDLTSTLSFMLGLPVPYNNLGTVIPECFADVHMLELATRTTAEQIMTYLEEYGDKEIIDSLEAEWQSAIESKDLLHSVKQGHSAGLARMAEWLKTGSAESDTAAIQHSIDQHRAFTLAALDKLRALWAQFSIPLIAVGLTILGLSIPTTIAFYLGLRNNGVQWDLYARLALETAAMTGGATGGVLGVVAGVYTRKLLAGLYTALASAALASEITLIIPIFVDLRFPSFPSFPLERTIGPIILALHAISFASNSYIMWEDRVMLFFFTTIMVIFLIKSFLAPTSDMRWKIVALSLAIPAVVRLIGTITICREEQQPYCRVTFYSGLTPSAPTWALTAIIVLALQLPRAVARVLDLSKSLAGPARPFLAWVWRIALVLNAAHWLLEWIEHWDGLNAERIPLNRFLRLWLARGSLGIIFGALPYLFLTSGLCIEVKRETAQVEDKGAVTVFGFANAYGSTYLLYLLIPFTLVHLVNQPMGQLALGAVLLATLGYLELIDTRRDAILMIRSFASSATPGAFDPSSPSTTIVRPGFTDLVPLALLGYIGFFATGHQAVLTSIQWKAAFVGFTTVTYPFSPVFVALNAFGPFLLSAMSIPLLAIWNVSPRPQSTIPTLAHSLQLILGLMTYHTTVTFASAFFAAWLRRHLMVWKVFAPRFMLGGITLLVVDLGVVLALVGVRVTAWKVWRTFKCESV